MRQFLLTTLLLAGAGCQGFHDRLACRKGLNDCVPVEPCPQAEKKASAPKPVEKVGAPAPEPVRAPAIAQDVLLIPKMVYMPYVAQTPTVPVRMTSNANVVPQEKVGEPRNVGEDKALQKILDVCERLNDRCDHLERRLKERDCSPPTIVCPPNAPVCPTPLFRRPLFPRCEPLFQRCEPLPPCEPTEERINIGMPMQPGTSSRMPAGPSSTPQRPLVID